MNNQTNRTFRRLTTLLTPRPASWAARKIWPLMRILTDLRNARKDLANIWAARDWSPPSNLDDLLQDDYDSRVVPRRAQHPGPITSLLHWILRGLGIVFVVNVAPGMGHNTVEIDYFLRLLRSGKIPHKRYVLLRKPSPFHDDTLALYGKHFWFASNNASICNILAPVIARYADLRLNVGLSRLRWHLRDDKSCSLPPPRGQTFLYQIDKAENRAEWMRYYKLRCETQDITPLKDGMSLAPALQAFLGENNDRLALLHVKYHVGNASARPTDPLTYLPAIKWLKEQGYKIVLIGREEMPPEFAALGVLDYANAAIACYRFDLEMVAQASIVITAGSGIAMMPDCMGIPLVYLNSWHICMPLTSRRCVIIPTLITQRAVSRLLSVTEQCDLYWSLEDKGDELFPIKDYDPREATEDEVLAAVKEALALGASDNWSERQKKYRQLTMKQDEDLVGGRISTYFVDKHASILTSAGRDTATESVSSERSVA